MTVDENEHILDLRRRMVRLELVEPLNERDYREWIPVFEGVGRHFFVPRLRHVADGFLLSGANRRLRREWLNHAYDAQYPCWPDDRAPLSVCRLPLVDLADLLQAGDVADGHQVLLAGAGLGYTAALLCERLGDGQVTVVDQDANRVKRIRARLHDAGYQPAMSTRLPASGEPYDRVVTTNTLDELRVQPPWLARTKPGGKVLAILSTGEVLVVDVHEDQTAEGRFLPSVNLVPPFMPLPWASPADQTSAKGPRRRSRSTTLPPTVCDDFAQAPDGFKLHVRLNVGEIGSDTYASREAHYTHFLHRDGSWASVNSNDDGATWVVTQGGPRKLWTEIEKTYRQWRQLGEPGLADYRITLTATSLVVSIDGSDAWTLSLPS
jgi:protein-L-isoaspartate O-methyltransferase